jgi:hypothetical protein
MITLTITAESGEPFTVRFQARVLESGVVTWQDSDVNREVGKSQRYGLDENFRLIVEVPPVKPEAS